MQHRTKELIIQMILNDKRKISRIELFVLLGHKKHEKKLSNFKCEAFEASNHLNICTQNFELKAAKVAASKRTEETPSPAAELYWLAKMGGGHWTGAGGGGGGGGSGTPALSPLLALKRIRPLSGCTGR